MKKKVSEQENVLKKLITRDMVSITTFGDAPFFESEGELNRMHSIVRSKLRRLDDKART